MRFSIRWLLGAVAFMSAVCVTMIYARTNFSHLLALALFSFLLLSAVGAAYAKGGQRAFWGGSAIVGWSLFGSSFLPDVIPLPLAISRSLLNQAHAKLMREIKVDDATAARTFRDSSDGYYKNGSYYIQLPAHGPFVTCGQVIAAFLASAVGGTVAKRFYSKSQSG